jgi:glycosyltransferase involved in cell wall biosynthesis
MARAIQPPAYPDAAFPPLTPAQNEIPRVLIAIPCYNEELTIGSLVLRAKRYSDDILIINDGSKDATADIAEDAGAVVISHSENQGKAASVLTAVQYAKHLKYDALVLLDGDGQHNVDEIPVLLDPILQEEADMVIGSRFLRSSSGEYYIPPHRRLGQKTLDLVTNASCSYKGSDTQSGYRALSRRAIMQLNMASEGYNIESDMIRHLSEQGLAITEVPISVRYDIPNGHKKNTLTHGFDIFSHIVGLISYRRPMLAFGIPGLLLTLIGLILGISTLSSYYALESFQYYPILIALVALILGLLLVVAAFIMNSLAQIGNSQKLNGMFKF